MIDRKDRRLATILALDAVAYSRMMASDDTGTLNRVLEVRRKIFEPVVSEFDGRIFKLTGDGLLVEFSSVSNAVRCADSIQKQLSDLQKPPGNPPLQFRIGIHLGEVIADGDDLYGDGVNVAARIEALAEPGGIAVSAPVYDQVKSRLSAKFVDRGEHEVKNIPQPVRVYWMKDSAPAPGLPVSAHRLSKRTVALVLGAILLVSAAIAGWSTRTSVLVSDRQVTQAAALNKPSIAVLPFDNLSGEEEQTYFSDGMTDNLITDLSRVRGLLVIARNTSFSFRERGESTDAQSVGKALGVR